MTAITSGKTWRTPMLVLAAAAITVILSMGLRSSFGLFLRPVSADLGWGREIFAFGMALQNLLWGVFQPVAGAIADRFGAGRVIAGGGVLYALGLYVMSTTSSPLDFHVSAGLLIGMAQSGAGLSVVLGAAGRAFPEERRSWALGVITAAGSLGQFSIVPLGQAFLSAYGWQVSFALLGIIALLIVPMAPALRGRAEPLTAADDQTLGQALREAVTHKGFLLLTLGFYVCGFHVAFIGVHLPAYLVDRGASAELGAWALALIGLFNIVGSYTAGVLGGRRSKKYLLSTIYVLRAAAFFGFIIVPVTVTSTVLFSAAIGLLWLSTIPLTSGLVAQIFGPRYMATLFGVVFFGHQLGSFTGVWLGGYLFDTTGSYDVVWWAGVALGIAAAIVHWPIDDKAVARLEAIQAR
ncbi:MAG: MFS transporter [Alphaproteobacteria bacterium]|jgi:MFS family permease|nr:MFS transporter [Alphaproteobacteria bacterium]HJP23462.1 MFS transporter [Alphaproteobacteria bacterium]